MPSAGFLIFVMFNHYYRNGNHRKGVDPRFSTILLLMLYEACLLMIIDGAIWKFTNFSLLEAMSFQGVRGGRLTAFLLFLLLYPVNHWYFIKNRGFDKLYEEHQPSELNTKKNRVLCAVIWVLGLIGLISIAAAIKNW